MWGVHVCIEKIGSLVQNDSAERLSFRISLSASINLYFDDPRTTHTTVASETAMFLMLINGDVQGFVGKEYSEVVNHSLVLGAPWHIYANVVNSSSHWQDLQQ